ncbi:mucin-6-like [Callorhinchus milii]|uniref:mucin-6-like n=1 Tax=Callorhinchus milii TaxID=7868 RepID=UPI001C3FDA5D|nr:mucin-6-like [Callorhinchus milii]
MWNSLQNVVIEADPLKGSQEKAQEEIPGLIFSLITVVKKGSGEYAPASLDASGSIINYPVTLYVKSPTTATCTTWGSDHFNTFDNYMYDFSSKCNYIFVSDCSDSFSGFNIQIRRGSHGYIKRISIQILNIQVVIENGNIQVNNKRSVSLPYNLNGIQIKAFGDCMKLMAKQKGFDLVVAWNYIDYLMVELGDEFRNKTCGLCGDFNGHPQLNEFESEAPALCPGNQVYQECGSPCLSTCSNPQSTCDSYGTYGCFCSEGTVLDDTSTSKRCIPQRKCPCFLNGRVYAPGEIKESRCSTCVCVMGQWNCTNLPCPGRCSIEGSSFVTTFDSRSYRFHGACTYLLMKSGKLPNNGAIEAVFEKCGATYSETCLLRIIYVTNQKKIIISNRNTIEVNANTKKLPYQDGEITIYRQSSLYIQMVTNFGLDIQIQTHPVFQVYVVLDKRFSTTTHGLCGNFDGDSRNDFSSSVGIGEGTAALFVDSWRVTEHCKCAHDKDTDPCSLSQSNSIYAQSHCSVLLSTSNIFGKCHFLVDPTDYYQRCKYETCNYESSQDFMCAALGSYAQACATKGLILTGWRSLVKECTILCSNNQEFTYDSKACNHTCFSLSNPNLECSENSVPTDGCNCPPSSYLDETNTCVSASSCPCFLPDGVVLSADQTAVIWGKTWATPQSAANRFKVYNNPLYLKFEFTMPGKLELIIIWNKNMNAYITITRISEFSVCGLCGNYNGNLDDEYITQSKSLASNVLYFANSWKEDPMCKDVTEIASPCDKNPYRLAWAEKMCAIINSKVFESCHKRVFWMPYYDNCVRDGCGCELVGDCECLCDAIAVYAKACLDEGIAIDWRAPSICPVYCDYFNSHKMISADGATSLSGTSRWHYQPCLCPGNILIFGKNNMEGCYNCGTDEYFDEVLKRCEPCGKSLIKPLGKSDVKARTIVTFAHYFLSPSHTENNRCCTSDFSFLLSQPTFLDDGRQRDLGFSALQPLQHLKQLFTLTSHSPTFLDDGRQRDLGFSALQPLQHLKQLPTFLNHCRQGDHQLTYLQPTFLDDGRQRDLGFSALQPLQHLKQLFTLTSHSPTFLDDGRQRDLGFTPLQPLQHLKQLPTFLDDGRQRDLGFSALQPLQHLKQLFTLTSHSPTFLDDGRQRDLGFSALQPLQHLKQLFTLTSHSPTFLNHCRQGDHQLTYLQPTFLDDGRQRDLGFSALQPLQHLKQLPTFLDDGRQRDLGFTPLQPLQHLKQLPTFLDDGRQRDLGFSALQPLQHLKQLFTLTSHSPTFLNHCRQGDHQLTYLQPTFLDDGRQRDLGFSALQPLQHLKQLFTLTSHSPTFLDDGRQRDLGFSALQPLQHLKQLRDLGSSAQQPTFLNHCRQGDHQLTYLQPTFLDDGRQRDLGFSALQPLQHLKQLFTLTSHSPTFLDDGRQRDLGFSALQPLQHLKQLFTLTSHSPTFLNHCRQGDHQLTYLQPTFLDDGRQRDLGFSALQPLQHLKQLFTLTSHSMSHLLLSKPNWC